MAVTGSPGMEFETQGCLEIWALSLVFLDAEGGWRGEGAASLPA